MSAVDSASIPQRRLSTGALMPSIGLGTFGSDHASAGEVADAVRGAFEAGYRHFDCAAVYGNEREIGQVLRSILTTTPREKLWITSKLWNDKHGEADVVPACRQSLADLQLNYLDLYLVHWPFPNWHPPRASVASRSANARPYIHDDFMKTWRQMERLVESGLVRHIGTSNITIPKLQMLLRDARLKPAVNEMELHPHFQQPELFKYVVQNEIIPVGYSPLGSPNRPTRDTTSTDTIDLDDPIILDIARQHDVHPSAVCLKWAVQRGQVPIPMSTKRANYTANLHAIATDPLSEEEMTRISTVDKNCRLIKGQVFLWKPGQSWEDLWDSSGEITPP